MPLLLLLQLFSVCYGGNSTTGFTGNPSAAAAVNVAAQVQIAQYQLRAASEYSRLKARRIAAALDDRQLAAQVIISGIDGKGRLPEHMKVLLAECPAGGIMLFRYNLDTDNAAIQSLIEETQAAIVSEHNIPPFAAIDHEGGSVNRFRAGVAALPAAASYEKQAQEGNRNGALAQVSIDSFNAGKALNALGINVNLAPVAEYLHEDNREFLDDRSYSPDPVFAAEAAAAFIAGMEQAGILCVVKHFPGSAGVDPHRFPSVLNGDKVALAQLVSPIAALIHSGRARAIMVSHSSVPAWDNSIASLSPVIMGGWLRRELGFTGLIICDDFSMESARSPASYGSAASTGSAASINNRNILSPEAAAVRSLAAGADMVLVWPPDLRRTHRAIVAALAAGNEGSLSRERLREAAQRIILAKMHMGLIDEQ